MSLEKAIAELTLALQENTAALQGSGKATATKTTETAAKTTAAAKAKPAAKAAKGPTLDTIKKRFGEYLGIEDKAERKERITHVSAIVSHFGVAKASDLEEENWVEALDLLAQYEAGEDPFSESDGEDDALV